jgi:hypothetical protein
MRSPRRLSSPTTSERRRPRSEPSDSPVSFRGIWTRRPSARIAMATWRRLRPSNRPKDSSPERARPTQAVRAVYEAFRVRATTLGRWSRGAPPRTSVGRPQIRSRRSAINSPKPRNRRSPDGLSAPPGSSSRRGRYVNASAVPPRERERSWRARTGPRRPGRPEPSACESSDHIQRRPAPRVRASDAMSAMVPVKRARFAFTMDSFVSRLGERR